MFNYIRTRQTPSRIGTSRSITIPTSPATLVVTDSGFMGWQMVCLGPGALAYGDAGVTVGTGGLLYYSMSKEFYPVADTMSFFLIADSVATVVRLNGYL